MPRTIRQRRRKAPRLRRQRQRSLLLSYQPGGSPAARPTPPDFGKPRYTQAQQAANPDKPMTRIVKDVLRTGRWLAGTTGGGSSWWVVTPGTLEQVAKSFRLARGNGVAPNLIYDHGDVKTGQVSGRDIIAEIDDVRVQGDTLWIAAYVTPAQARQLSLPANKVSVGVDETWHDGRGRTYRHFLAHVGVVDLPVVDSQGPFLTLSRRRRGTTRKASTMPMNRRQRLALAAAGFRLADSDSGDGTENETPTDEAITGGGVDALIDLIDSVLQESLGVGLPEATTGETLVHDLQVITQVLFASPADEEPADESSGDLADAAADALAEPLTMSRGRGNRSGGSRNAAVPSFVGPIMRQLRTLATRVDGLQAGNGESAREAYRAELDRLAVEGNIDAATRIDLEAEGEANGYRLSLLQPFRHTRMVGTGGSRARRLATGQAPATSRSSGPPDPDRARKLAEVINGKRSIDDPEL